MPCVLPRYVSEVTVEAHAHVRGNNTGKIMPTRARLRSGEVNPVLQPTFHVRSNEMHAQLSVSGCSSFASSCCRCHLHPAPTMKTWLSVGRPACVELCGVTDVCLSHQWNVWNTVRNANRETEREVRLTEYCRRGKVWVSKCRSNL